MKKTLFLITGLILFVALIISSVYLHSKYLEKHPAKTPVQWCMSEIYHTEGYEDARYIYQELKYAEYESDEYTYIITTYTDEHKTEWACFIKAQHSNFFYRATGKQTYSYNEILDFDCDEIIIKYFEED